MKTLAFPESAESTSLADRYGYDAWLVSRFMEYMPEVREFLDKMDRPPTRYIRVNTLKTSRVELADRLESKGFLLKGTAIPEVLAVENAPIARGPRPNTCLGIITYRTSARAWQSRR